MALLQDILTGFAVYLTDERGTWYIPTELLLLQCSSCIQKPNMRVLLQGCGEPHVVQNQLFEAGIRRARRLDMDGSG